VLYDCVFIFDAVLLHVFFNTNCVISTLITKLAEKNTTHSS